jgi:hypothetical protein
MSDMFFTEEDLLNERIHHEAKVREIEGEYARTKSTMLTYVENAQAALGKDKLHVVAYQLDVLAEMLGGE